MHSTTSWWVISRGCWRSPGETSCKEGAPPKTTKKHCCGCYQIAVVARSLHGGRQQTSWEPLRYLWTLRNCALQTQQTYFKRLLLWKQMVFISGFHRTLSEYLASSCKQQAITAGDKSNHKQVFCTAQHSYLWLISPSKNVFFLSDWWLPGSFRPVFRLVRLQPSSLQKKKTDLPVAHYQVITLDHNLLREKKLTLNLSK